MQVIGFLICVTALLDIDAHEMRRFFCFVFYRLLQFLLIISSFFSFD